MSIMNQLCLHLMMNVLTLPAHLDLAEVFIKCWKNDKVNCPVRMPSEPLEYRPNEKLVIYISSPEFNEFSSMVIQMFPDNAM